MFTSPVFAQFKSCLKSQNHAGEHRDNRNDAKAFDACHEKLMKHFAAGTLRGANEDECLGKASKARLNCGRPSISFCQRLNQLPAEETQVPWLSWLSGSMPPAPLPGAN